jgi:hypothetical protein
VAPGRAGAESPAGPERSRRRSPLSLPQHPTAEAPAGGPTLSVPQRPTAEAPAGGPPLSLPQHPTAEAPAGGPPLSLPQHPTAEAPAGGPPLSLPQHPTAEAPAGGPPLSLAHASTLQPTLDPGDPHRASRRPDPRPRAPSTSAAPRFGHDTAAPEPGPVPQPLSIRCVGMRSHRWKRIDPGHGAARRPPPCADSAYQ